MKSLSAKVARPLIRLTYFLPLIVGILMLIWACIPHIFFVYNKIPTKENHNLFGLMANTWKECNTLLDGTTEGSGNAILFSYLMNFCVVFAWVCILVYAAVAIAAAICSTRAFSFAPTAKESNRAKRWMQLFCPNRGLYVFIQLLPLFPAAFPLILAHAYRALLGYDMTAGFIGIPDLLLTALLTLLAIAAWLCLLPAQNREHMDLYRLYKAKK